MNSSEFNISISVENYDEETDENYRNCYVAEKRIVSKLSKISIPILIAQIEDLNEGGVNISRPIFYTFRNISRQRALRSGRVGPIHHFK